MRVVALISGGKDSCYNMMQCVSEGHDIVALANLQPKDKDELDSYMYQTVGHHAIDLYAEAMSLPLYRRVIQGSSKQIGRYYSPTADDEVEDLYELLKKIKDEIDIEGVSSGAILSDYQRVRVENVCERLGLTSLAYLWRRNQRELLKEMIDCQVEAIIIKVAALGLHPGKHLGKSLADIYPYMLKMEQQFGLNVCGEGGEYETFTLDCPLFKKKLVVDEKETVLHSEDDVAAVGYLNLIKMHLKDRPPIKCSAKECLESLPMKRGCDILSELFTEKERDESVTQSQYAVADNSSVADCFLGEVHVQTSVCGKWFSISGLAAKYQDGKAVENATKELMDKLKDSVEKLDQRLSDIVSVCLYVRNLSDFSRINSVYRTYFSLNPPVRVCVQAACPADTVMLMDCVGHLSDDQTPHSSNKDTMHVQSMSHWAAANIGPYSQAVHVNNKIFVAGTIALCPSNMNLISGGITVEARLSLRHLTRLLAAMHSGCSLLNVSLVIGYVVSLDLVSKAETEWKRAVEEEQLNKSGACHKPVFEFVVVPLLPRGALIEWQAVTYTGDEPLQDGEFSITLDTGVSISMDYCYSADDDNHYFSSRTKICQQERNLTVCLQSVQEIVKVYKLVLESHGLCWSCVPLLRIFYPGALCSYIQLYSAILSAIGDIPKSPPGFSLIPVTRLASEDSIVSVCC